MKITENVYQLESSKRSHVFLIKDNENILIDTGMPGLAANILAELKSMGIPKDGIKQILLTHHDVDHIGNAEKLTAATGAELWAPAEDTPYICGLKNREGVKLIIQTIVRLKNPVISGTYSAGQSFGEIKAIRAPGHTPGHTIFHYKNVLFTGDLFKFFDGRFSLLPKFMNWNHDEVRKSIAILKGLDFEWLCPSHGEPIQNGPTVQEFLSGF